MTGRLAIYVVKKYRGHRTIPDSWRTALTAGYHNTFHEDISDSMLPLPVTIAASNPEISCNMASSSPITHSSRFLGRMVFTSSCRKFWCRLGESTYGASRYSECRIRGRFLKVLAGKECKVKNKVSSPYLFHLICDAEYTKSLTEKQIDQWLVPVDAEASTSDSLTLEEFNMNEDE